MHVMHKMVGLGAVALVLVTAAGNAHAYRFLCDSVDANGNLARSDGCPCTLATAQRFRDAMIDWRVQRQDTSRVPTSEWTTAALEALNAWNRVGCKTLLMRDIGDVSNPDFGTRSSQHTIFWLRTNAEWQRTVGGGVDGTLAITSTPYSYGGSCERASIDADIAMNDAAGFKWTTDMASCTGDCHDVVTTLAHELGHAAGLGHPCTNNPRVGDACPAGGTVMQAISAYREDVGQPLQDDVNGICALYPGNARALGAPCMTGTDCDSSLCVDDAGVSYCSQACGTCPTGFRCSSGHCIRSLPQIGEACSGSCVDGAVCLPDGTSSTCHRICDPAAPSGCAADETCQDFGGGFGACTASGSQQPGARCGTGFPNCAGDGVCIIVEPDPQVAYCFDGCTVSTDCSSDQRCDASLGACVAARPEGAVCFDTYDSSCALGLLCLCDDADCTSLHCARDCSSDPNLCSLGQYCAPLTMGGGVCITYLLEGQRCSGFGYGECADGLICAGGFEMRCHGDCTTSRTCPEGFYCNAYEPSRPDGLYICEDTPAPVSSSSSGATSSSSSWVSSSAAVASSASSRASSASSLSTSAPLASSSAFDSSMPASSLLSVASSSSFAGSASSALVQSSSSPVAPSSSLPGDSSASFPSSSFSLGPVSSSAPPPSSNASGSSSSSAAVSSSSAGAHLASSSRAAAALDGGAHEEAPPPSQCACVGVPARPAWPLVVMLAFWWLRRRR